MGAITKTVIVRRDGEVFHVIMDGETYHVTETQIGRGMLRFSVGGQRVQSHVAHVKDRCYVAVAGQHWVLERLPAPRSQRSRGESQVAGSGRLQASMPGLVVGVLVTAGDAVEWGQTLVLLEAMKMELRIQAPFAGQVSQVHCEAGQVVERGQVLVEVEGTREACQL
jgi:biotin carboxyl carrier protein